jgi:hypothetical protein
VTYGFRSGGRIYLIREAALQVNLWRQLVAAMLRMASASGFVAWCRFPLRQDVAERTSACREANWHA